ncbi:MAG: hypothetical protein R3E97_14980 [Candidatus Eisenbacteria bacterium]
MALALSVIGVGLFLPSLIWVMKSDIRSTTAVQAADQLLYLHATFWIPAVLAVILIVTDSIRTSHRIVGPLHRFNLALAQLRSGRIPDRIQLREGDHLMPMCERINEAIDEACARTQAQADAHEQILALVARLREAEATIEDPSSRAAIHDILYRLEGVVTDASHSLPALGPEKVANDAPRTSASAPASERDERRAA